MVVELPDRESTGRVSSNQSIPKTCNCWQVFPECRNSFVTIVEGGMLEQVRQTTLKTIQLWPSADASQLYQQAILKLAADEYRAAYHLFQAAYQTAVS